MKERFEDISYAYFENMLCGKVSVSFQSGIYDWILFLKIYYYFLLIHKSFEREYNSRFVSYLKYTMHTCIYLCVWMKLQSLAYN